MIPPVGAQPIYQPQEQNNHLVPRGGCVTLRHPDQGRDIRINNNSSYDVYVSDITYDDEDDSYEVTVENQLTSSGILVEDDTDSLTIIDDPDDDRHITWDD